MNSKELQQTKQKLEDYNQNVKSLLFANPYSHSVKDKEGKLICCFCLDEDHYETQKKVIPVYKEVLNKEILRIKSFLKIKITIMRLS